jgi:hypothetical protein
MALDGLARFRHSAPVSRLGVRRSGRCHATELFLRFGHACYRVLEMLTHWHIVEKCVGDGPTRPFSRSAPPWRSDVLIVAYFLHFIEGFEFTLSAKPRPHGQDLKGE